MNNGLHPMELEWALVELKQKCQPSIYDNEEGDMLNIVVSSYLDYKNGIVDINGHAKPFVGGAEISEYGYIAKVVTFKAARYRKTRYARQWMEWVLA